MSNPEQTDPVELDLPDGVMDAEQAVELIRAWVADGALMVSLNGGSPGRVLSNKNFALNDRSLSYIALEQYGSSTTPARQTSASP